MYDVHTVQHIHDANNGAPEGHRTVQFVYQQRKAAVFRNVIHGDDMYAYMYVVPLCVFFRAYVAQHQKHHFLLSVNSQLPQPSPAATIPSPFHNIMQHQQSPHAPFHNQTQCGMRP